MTMLSRLFAAPALALGLALTLPAAGLAGEGAAVLDSSVAAERLRQKKRTEPGLYITAAEAAAVLATRDDVLLIDVRTPEETMLVGRPLAADANIPLRLIDPAHPLNAGKDRYGMMPNPGFVDAFTAFLDGKTPAAVIVMCRSGGRSAAAIDALAGTGLDLPLYSMVDGFEGDRDAGGKRRVNGWKNAGAEWTYKIEPGFLQRDG